MTSSPSPVQTATPSLPKCVPILILVAAIFALVAPTTRAELYTLSFDGADPFAPNTPYAPGVGLALSGGTIATAGIELNEVDFPPASGLQVYLAGDSGVIAGSFSTPVRSLGGQFTYALNDPNDRLILKAYDSNGALLGTVSSMYFENYVGNPTTPLSDKFNNEQLGFLDPKSEIASFRIEGLPVGGGFTMDNFRFEAVPEPSVIWAATSICAFAILRHLRKNNHE